jgi:hypothetical protein
VVCSGVAVGDGSGVVVGLSDGDAVGEASGLGDAVGVVESVVPANNGVPLNGKTAIARVRKRQRAR